VLVGNFCLAHQARILGQLAFVGADEVDFFDVFRAQRVLSLTLAAFAVGVDEQDSVALCVLKGL
jgi:hypothetical protein